MSSSFEASCNVALFGLADVCESPCPSSAVSGKREISSPEGKTTLGCAGGRRLLTRGISASAIKKRVNVRKSRVTMTYLGQPPWTAYLFYYEITPKIL